WRASQAKPTPSPPNPGRLAGPGGPTRARQPLADGFTELAVLHHNVPAHDGVHHLAPQPGTQKGAVLALAVQVFRLQRPFRVEVDEHEVGVKPRPDVALASGQAE